MVVMDDRRTESRLLCAELVEVSWFYRLGGRYRTVMNLEDISLSGACLQGDRDVALGTGVSISYGCGRLRGTVRHILHNDLGYFWGVQFASDCKWPEDKFRPRHLLDPKALLDHVTQTG